MLNERFPPVEVLEHLQHRQEKRMESLQRVKLQGFSMVPTELEDELDYIRRARRDLEG
jgi:hypothetical protein